MRRFGRRRERRAEASAAAWRELERRRTRQTDRARGWKASGPATPERIRGAYVERRQALPSELRQEARPIAAWHLREGAPNALDSYVGGFPALLDGEPWPTDRGSPMRFWAQVNLADLAPFAEAYEIRMPDAGLLQIFAEPEGGDELARRVAPDDLAALRPAETLPHELYWDDSPEVRGMLHTSLLIDLYPDALLRGDRPAGGEGTTSSVLPGWSFGWWSFDSYPLERYKQFEWPDAPDPEGWTFLAVCRSQRDLALLWGDAGDLWAAVPTDELAAGDFTHLHCDGESS